MQLTDADRFTANDPWNPSGQQLPLGMPTTTEPPTQLARGNEPSHPTPPNSGRSTKASRPAGPSLGGLAGMDSFLQPTESCASSTVGLRRTT